MPYYNFQTNLTRLSGLDPNTKGTASKFQDRKKLEKNLKFLSNKIDSFKSCKIFLKDTIIIKLKGYDGQILFQNNRWKLLEMKISFNQSTRLIDRKGLDLVNSQYVNIRYFLKKFFYRPNLGRAGYYFRERTSKNGRKINFFLRDSK